MPFGWVGVDALHFNAVFVSGTSGLQCLSAGWGLMPERKGLVTKMTDVCLQCLSAGWGLMPTGYNL